MNIIKSLSVVLGVILTMAGIVWMSQQVGWLYTTLIWFVVGTAVFLIWPAKQYVTYREASNGTIETIALGKVIAIYDPETKTAEPRGDMIKRAPLSDVILISLNVVRDAIVLAIFKKGPAAKLL